MGFGLFLNSVPELNLSFYSEYLYGNLNQISILVLWLLLLLFIFFVGIPSIPNFWRNEHTQKRQGRSKRRRKGGTQKGLRYHQREEEEERELISFLKSPLGQNHDSTRFRQLLCPDPSCEVCNNVTAEIQQIWEYGTQSVSPVAPTAAVTEPSSFTQSSAFSAVPPGVLISPPLPEASPPPPSILSSNPMTPLGNSRSLSPSGQTLRPESPSPSGQTLPPEPSPPPSESEFPGHHYQLQPNDLISSTLRKFDFHQGFLALHSSKISLGGDPAVIMIDLRQLLMLSPHEHDSGQHYFNPEIWEHDLKQKIIQLFWGLPTLHSESLPSADVSVSGDYSPVFNSILNAFTGQESPELSYFPPPSLPEVQPQPLPQTLLQSHDFDLTQIQPQAKIPSPLPILPSSLNTQNKVCEAYFHSPKNESEYLTSSEIEQPECNVLQKEQESLWSLTSVPQSSKAQVAISIETVEFPLGGELREIFEYHLRKRLIQHRWALPRRIHASLSLMRPLRSCSDLTESKISFGLSWISVNKDESSTNLNTGLSQPGRFHERGSETLQLEENVWTDEGHTQDHVPMVHLLNDLETSLVQDVSNESDMMSLSGEISVSPGHSVSERQLENVLKINLNKDFEAINEGQFPGTVPSSQHSIKQTSSVKSHTELKQTSVPSSVGGNYGLNTSKALAFLGRDAQQMLEAHMITFHQKMLRNLPTKVPESKYTASSSLIERNHVSSTKLISEVNTNSAAFTPRRSSESLHGDRAGTKNSAADLNLPLPDTPPVGKADFQDPLREDILKAKLSLRPVKKTFSGETNQKHPLTGNTEAPKLPARQAGTGYEIRTNTVNCNERVEIREGKKREKSEYASMTNVSREIVRAEGTDALLPRNSDILITRKPGLSQMNRGTIVTTSENPLSKISVTNPNLPELRIELIDDLKLRLKRQYNKAHGLPTNTSPDENNWTDEAPLTHTQGVSSVSTLVPQVLHVYSEDKVHTEKQHEPSLPKNMVRSCQGMNFPQTVKTLADSYLPGYAFPTSSPVVTSGSKSHDVGAGDARMRSSQRRGKRIPSQDTTLEDKAKSKSPQTRSQQGQAPPDSLFLNTVKSFFQKINPGVKVKTQENTQQKGTSYAQRRAPVQSRAAYTGATLVHRVMSDPGKLPEERVGHRHAIATTWPQTPLPAAAQFGKAPQKGAVQAPAGPVHGPPINSRVPSKSSLQAAILAGQTSTNSRKEDRQAHKAVALKGQHSVHQYPQSVPCRGTVPYSSLTWRPQATKGPPVVLTTAEGTVFRDQPGQFRHMMLIKKY